MIERKNNDTCSFTGGNEDTPTVKVITMALPKRDLYKVLEITQNNQVLYISAETLQNILDWATEW